MSELTTTHPESRSCASDFSLKGVMLLHGLSLTGKRFLVTLVNRPEYICCLEWGCRGRRHEIQRYQSSIHNFQLVKMNTRNKKVTTSRLNKMATPFGRESYNTSKFFNPLKFGMLPMSPQFLKLLHSHNMPLVTTCNNRRKWMSTS